MNPLVEPTRSQKYRWVTRPVEMPEAVARLQSLLNDLPEALARALVLRGITTFDDARRFFRPSLDALHDPFLMKDMDAAADRLARAIQGGERVLVYGDYDVDGTTATALMTGFLRSQGVDAHFFIPNRFEDGYGLGATGIDYAADLGASLIVALDCGITALDEADYAREQGLDLIICDHHKALDEIPGAVAVLDPKRPDCSYPFKELSGCGLGFKLAQATLTRLGKPPEAAHAYLDLVAISAASDIVPLYDENRILTAKGLEVLQQQPRLGLRMLAQEARLNLSTCTATRIVFTIGPRINAAGRLGDAGKAVELMLTEDPAEASRLAKELEASNKERRELDKAMQEEAYRLAERQITSGMPHALVLHRPDWHAGVIGIVASRVVERFYRPTIMLTSAGDLVKGSARSIAGLSIYDALKACEDLLAGFGGHDYAAGVSLPEANIPLFRERLNEAVDAHIEPELLTPAVEIDATLDLDVLGRYGERFWSVLKQFAPHGPDNLAPVFLARGLELARSPRTMGAGGQHLAFTVRQPGSEIAHRVVAWRMADDHLSTVRQSQATGEPLDLVFSVEENTWNGRTSLQLKARDLRLS